MWVTSVLISSFYFVFEKMMMMMMMKIVQHDNVRVYQIARSKQMSVLEALQDLVENEHVVIPFE